MLFLCALLSFLDEVCEMPFGDVLLFFSLCTSVSFLDENVGYPFEDVLFLFFVCTSLSFLLHEMCEMLRSSRMYWVLSGYISLSFFLTRDADMCCLPRGAPTGAFFSTLC